MAELLKNYYNPATIAVLVHQILKVYPEFESEKFQNSILGNEWESLELKQRMRKISTQIEAFLPFNYEKQIEILKLVAIHFNGFTAMLFPDFVEVFGLKHFEISIDALTHFTQYSSSEFAVRPFILQYPEKMYQQHLLWSKHKNYHVRRLASEGIRPRLPWAMAIPILKKNPAPILPILENLKNDESEYVRRSVANNLNDISKDHPEIVLEIAENWKGKSEATDKIIKHALRGLLKKGDAQALAIFGINQENHFEVSDFNVSKSNLKIGDFFHFEFKIKSNSKETQKLRLEYKIAFRKANGTLSKKVFQISEQQILPQAEIKVNKKHAFADLTTRKHYAGKHQIFVVANGIEIAEISFDLSE